MFLFYFGHVNAGWEPFLPCILQYTEGVMICTNELKSKDPLKNWVHILTVIYEVCHVREQISLSVVQSDTFWCQSPVKCQKYLQKNSRYIFLISIFFLSIYFGIRSGFTFIYSILIHTSIWNMAIKTAIAKLLSTNYHLQNNISLNLTSKNELKIFLN